MEALLAKSKEERPDADLRHARRVWSVVPEEVVLGWRSNAGTTMRPDVQGLRQVKADVRWRQHRKRAQRREELARRSGTLGHL